MSEKNPYFGATFAERKAARLAAEGKPAKTSAKQVDEDTEQVEDKAVTAEKTTRKRTAKKS
jgi:hypothetical protein